MGEGVRLRDSERIAVTVSVFRWGHATAMVPPRTRQSCTVMSPRWQ